MAANPATAPYAKSTARISTQIEFRNRLVEANSTSSRSLSLSRIIPESRNCNGILESLGRHQASAITSNGAVMRNRAWAPKSWRKYQNDPSCANVSRIAVNASSGGHPMSATMKARRRTRRSPGLIKPRRRSSASGGPPSNKPSGIGVTGLDELYPNGIPNQLGACADAHLPHDFIFVRFGGPGRDPHHGCHFLHRLSLGKQLQHLTLAQGECRFARDLFWFCRQQSRDQVSSEQRCDVRSAPSDALNRFHEFFCAAQFENVTR